MPWMTLYWEEEVYVQKVDSVATYWFNGSEDSVIPTGTDGKGPHTSADGNVTVACGPSNAFTLNGSQHGTEFKTGNTITVKVAGDTKIVFGGCQYSNGGSFTVTDAAGNTVATVADTKTSACPGYQSADDALSTDTASTYAIEYTGEATTLTITFNTSKTYMPWMTLYWEEEKVVNLVDCADTYWFNGSEDSVIPTGTDGKGPHTSADGNVTVACGPSNAFTLNGSQHGTEFKTGNTITVKVAGDTKIVFGGCQYSNGGSFTVTDAAGNTVATVADTKTSACPGYQSADDALSTDTASTYAIEYTGEATTLTITFNTSKTYMPWMTLYYTAIAPDTVPLEIPVSIGNGVDILGDDLVTITSKDDAADTHTVGKDGATFTLISETAYALSTENPKIKATSNGKSYFTTGKEAAAVVIDVESLVVNPTIKFVDEESVLGDAVITLTNEADATEVVTVKDGETAELWIGGTYKVTSSSASVVPKIGGGISVKVEASLETIEIVLTAADLTHHTYDVWDFGAEQLANTDLATYNNKLTKEIINSWYVDETVVEGTQNSSYRLPMDTNDIVVNDADGNPEWILSSANGTLKGKWRLRANANSGLTRDADENSIADEYGNAYQGLMYDNAGKGKGAVMQLAVKSGDIVTVLVSSNGGESTITWTAPSGAQETQLYTRCSRTKMQTMTFYAAEDGMYTMGSADEKFVVARIYRERPDKATVSGTVTVPEGADLNGKTLVFTNQTTGAATEATITNGAYSVELSQQYKYAVSLTGANGYIVDSSVTADNGIFKLANEEASKTVDVTIVAVDLVTLTGSLADLTAEDAAKLEMVFAVPAGYVYAPEFTVTSGTNNYTLVLEKGVSYTVTSVTGVDDYTLKTAIISATADGTMGIKFEKKPVYAVNVTLEGPTATEAANAKFTFSRLVETDGTVDGTLDGYSYTFTGTDGIELRDGQYKVTVALDGYTQQITADVKVDGAATSATIKMKSDSAVEDAVAYKEVITVGTSGDYQTINDALDAVRLMNREEGQRVTISIEPGNYEEMLLIDVDDVTLQNAAGENASIGLINKGVDIEENAVRITSYYGHGYAYSSMGADYMYDEDVLAANKSNGYYSVKNPGSGTGTMWNATVIVKANGFQADGIIFENSFNQYVSKKASEDVIWKLTEAKEGSVPRATMQAGDVTVQNKKYVERAGALSIGNNFSGIVFDNCKFVGRQDTLYGGKNTYVEFNECSIYGGTDYIYGGMIAIFNKCDLVFNTMEDNNDVGYITAAQQDAGRGYLMYECHITSTVPGVDTASEYTSKPGYLGRPWSAATSEVVFYNTTIDAADEHWGGGSLIKDIGWNDSLGGKSAGMYEYGTVETSGVDNSAARATWATMLTDTVLSDGTEITFDAFRKEEPIEGLYEIDLSAGLKAGVEYDGGISVLEDMNMKSDGYIQGSNNPKTESGSGAKGEVPATGAVLILKAEQDGFLKYSIKDGNKTTYFVDGTTGDVTSYAQAASGVGIKSFAVEAGHTYYLYAGGSKLCFYTITVDYREPNAWDTIAAPVLGTPVVDAEAGTITVPFVAAVGGLNADSLDVRMLLEGSIADTISYVIESDEGTVTFEPEASGAYTFQGFLKRAGVQSKESNVTEAVTFVLPMRDPVIVNAENQGNGAIRFSWQEVNEAEAYEVYLNGELKDTVTVPYYRFTGLTQGTEYEFGVIAVGNNDKSEMSTMKQTVSVEAQKSWLFSAYGQGIDTKNNALIDPIEGADDTSLSLKSQGGKGKIVPASTDGLAFYYTTIDPETENFTLSADITVDSWTLSNGQEGFGIMATDAVGTHGDNSVFWNNAYMGIASKVEYYWDDSAKAVASSGAKYSMKLGVGSMEKIGVTQDNIDAIAGGNLDEFISSTKTLETSAALAGKDAGTYNIVGNYTNADDSEMGTIKKQTTFHMTLQRNNTGYLISYTDENGQTMTNTYYHGEDGDALTKIDPNNIYVGFFASRYATITVDNVSLTTINPADDAPAEERPITYVSPGCSIESADITNTSDYELVYYGKADGKLTISHGSTIYAENVEVKAEEKYRIIIPIGAGGKMEIKVAFTPDPDFVPSKYERLSSYDTVYMSKTVTYGLLERNIIYVSPGGYGTDGTKEHPMNIYDAVKYVQPGNVIIMLGGTYNLEKTLTIQRGINGTEEKPIYLMADPDATTRPVLDFGGLCAGMVLAGDYWYLQGFDVTNSAPGQKGLQVSGDYNVVDDIHAYRNGNTGIQISRFKGSDAWEDWPHDNLILNCTSYLNADPGYEDADGFAAKLTIGDNNVFDGCIAAYNADDGWDLFAKIESGPIGKVTIKNSLAFKNGYDIDANGNEINAGNGNGFKMGGSSISGYHLIENSVAFANKSKGIDSNSCPDIQVVNCTSFDNESYNVAFYTNEAANTDYSADGLISYKISNTVADSLKLKGTQDEGKVYKDSNYYWLGKASKNNSGEVVTSDWFKSLDTDAAIHGGITRNADGTINMNGYLELNEASEAVQAMVAANSVFGATISGTVMNSSASAGGNAELEGSKDIELPELVVRGDATVDGDSSSSGSDTSGENGGSTGTGTDAGSASSPKTSFDEDSYVHSILWPETDSDKAVAEDGVDAEAAADAEDVVIAGASLVQNAEENGMGGMLAVIIVAVIALAAASGIVLFRKREEEM